VNRLIVNSVCANVTLATNNGTGRVGLFKTFICSMTGALAHKELVIPSSSSDVSAFYTLFEDGGC